MTDSQKQVPTVGWQQVLRLLQIPVPHETLPLRISCPLCRRASLCIMKDTAQGGQWHYCESCHSCGDMVQLAAMAWGVDYATAGRKLQRTGLPPLAAKARQLGIIAQMEKLRAISKVLQIGTQQNLPISFASRGDVGLFLHRPNISAPEQWQSLWRSMVSIISREQLLSIREKGWYPHAPGSKSTIAVLPGYDLPGRISGLWLGLGGDKQRPSFTRHVAIQQLGWLGRDAGLYFHPDFKVWEHTAELFAYPNADNLLPSLMRHMRALPGMGAIVAYSAGTNDDATTTDAWDMTRKARVYMVAPKVTPEYVWQAWRANANLFFAKIEDTHLAVYSYLQSPSKPYLEQRRIIYEKAQPWELALATAAAGMPEEEFDTAIIAAKLPDEAYRHLLQVWPQHLRDRLEAKLPSTVVQAESTAAEQYQVINDKLYRVGAKESLVCDAIIRVERVVYAQGSSDVRYEGYVQYRQQSFPFVTSAASIEHSTARWLRNFLLQQHAGLLQKGAPAADLLSVFLRLYPPSTVTVVERVGWNTAQRCLDFPKFSLHSGGEIRPQSCLDDVEYPAEHWMTPEPLTPAEVQEATSDKFTDFWAIAAAVIYNGLCQLWQERPRPIFVESEVIPGQVWRALGCLTTSLKNTMHSWPRAVLQKPTVALGDWLLDGAANKNFVLGGDWWTSRLLQLASPLGVRVSCKSLWQSTMPLEHLGPKLLPAYLLDLATRNFELGGGGAVLPRLVQDVASWAHRTQGQSGPVLAAGDRLHTLENGGVPQALGEIYAQLFLANTIDLLTPREAVKQSNKPVIWLRKSTTALPIGALRAAATKRYLPEPDVGAISDALRYFNLPALRDDHESYWQVPPEWFHEFFPKKLKGSSLVPV